MAFYYELSVHTGFLKKYHGVVNFVPNLSTSFGILGPVT